MKPHLTDEEVRLAQLWTTEATGCTCPAVFDGVRYAPMRHTCRVCRGWDKTMSELGVTGIPKTTDERGKRKYRRAA